MASEDAVRAQVWARTQAWRKKQEQAVASPAGARSQRATPSKQNTPPRSVGRAARDDRNVSLAFTPGPAAGRDY